MFYCERCRRKWKWPSTVVDSHVRNCEICGSRGPVQSTPASELPDPIGILLPEEIENDA